MKAKKNRPKRTPQKAKSPAPIIDAPPAPQITESVFSRMGVVIPWIITLWLIAMTVWYVQTAAEAIKQPLNKGSEMELFKIWIILIAAVVVSHAIFLRRFVTLVWIGILIVGAGTMIVSSHSVMLTLILVWLLTLGYVSANWLIRRLGAKPSEVPMEWTSVCLAIGLALLATLGFGLSVIGRLNVTLIWIVLIGLTLLQLRAVWRVSVELSQSIRRQLASAGDRTPNEYGALVVVIGIIVLFNLIWALAPEIQYDALNYHLPTARTYLAEQKMILKSYTLLAHLVEMLYAISLALQGQIGAKLLTFAMSIIATFAIYVIGRTAFSSRVGLWAAALFYCTPLVSWLAVNTYVDLVVGMFLATTVVAFLRWRQTRQDGWLWACGILTGAAAGAKMTGFMGLPIIGLVLLWDLFRIRGVNLVSKIKTFAGYLVCALLTSVPWYLKVFIATGNPFFPLLNGVFKSPFAPLANLNSNAADFTLGQSPFAIFSLPFVFTFETERFGEALPSGSLGFALALFPLVLLLLIKRHIGAGILFAVATVYLLLLGYSMPYGRYYIPTLPVVAVLGAAAVIHLSTTKWLRELNLLCLGVVLIAQASIIPLMYWNIPERVPFGVASGAESREAFLARALPMYSAVQYVNSKSPASKVAAIGAENMRFYFNSVMSSAYEMGPYLRGSTGQEWADSLAKSGFTYLVINKRSPETTLPIPYISQSFLAKYGVLEYTANGTDVYRLLNVAAGAVTETNLLSNPGFEMLAPTGLPANWMAYGQPGVVQDKKRAHTEQVSVVAGKADGFFYRVPVEANKIYSLGHWTRADLPNQLARLQINWVNDASQMLAASIDVVAVGPTWSWNQISAMSPEGATSAVIYVTVHQEGKVWFDDFAFVKGQLQPRP